MSNILIINNSENNSSAYSSRIEKILTNNRFEFHTISYAQTNIRHLNFDKIILTGSPRGNDIVSHHLPYYNWIKEYNGSLLGICAGHHILGVLFGSKLLRSIEPEYGYFYNYCKTKNPLFAGLEDTFLSRQMHNDSITLPEHFNLLASSTRCYNQAMKHKKRSLYSLQFHPEYINEEIILNFIRFC